MKVKYLAFKKFVQVEICKGIRCKCICTCFNNLHSNIMIDKVKKKQTLFLLTS